MLNYNIIFADSHMYFDGRSQHRSSRAIPDGDNPHGGVELSSTNIP